MAEIKKVIKNGTTYDVFNSDNVDPALNTSSTNAIQNGAVATALETKITNPSGGTAGQYLKKTANGEEWSDVEALPSGGTVGQVLTKTQGGADWEDAQGGLPEGGTEGQFIRKTANGSEWVDGELVEIRDDYSAMRGPCAEGFHVPLVSEWVGVKTIMDLLSLTTSNDWVINLHIPKTGAISVTGTIGSRGSFGGYWTSTPYEPLPRASYYLNLQASSIKANDVANHPYGYNIRPFKDNFVKPDSTWTVIQGTLGSAGIFWDTTNGLISITGDGNTGYTIADKNLGATSVYSNGDTLSEANCGKYYQRGNNYGFPFSGSVTTSSTKVDASGYGPGNYYNSSTFITPGGNDDWTSVTNNNLRGRETGAILGGKYVGEDKINEVPTDGTVGQVITKTNGGYEFQNVVNSINGKTGNVKNAILNIPYTTYSKVYDNTTTLGSSTSEHAIGSLQTIAAPSGTKIILYTIDVNSVHLWKRLFVGYGTDNYTYHVLHINSSSNAIDAYLNAGVSFYGSGNIFKLAVAIKHPSSWSSTTIKETIYCFTQ